MSARRLPPGRRRAGARSKSLRTVIALEMPPFTAWFRGREAVRRFLSNRAFGEPGSVTMVPVRANGQPAAADYRLGADGLPHGHALRVLTADESGSLAAITVVLDPELFAVFGLPATR